MDWISDRKSASTRLPISWSQRQETACFENLGKMHLRLLGRVMCQIQLMTGQVEVQLISFR